jgi:hypothetical protein
MRVHLFAEDLCGAQNVQTVCDSISFESITWLARDLSSSYQSIRAVNKPSGAKKFGSSARSLGIAQTPATKATANAYFAIRESHNEIGAVFVATDIDRKTDRWLDNEMREKFAQFSPPLIVAEMNPEAEAWRIVAFSPVDQAERDNFEQLKKDLSFNPSTEPERMNSSTGNERDCKIVSSRIFKGNVERSLDGLRQNAEVLSRLPKQSGLPQFVAEVLALIEPQPD